MRAFKIVEFDGKNIRTLFHAAEEGRIIPRGKWSKAITRIGSDGTGHRLYRTGWHSLPTLKDAREYSKRFTERLDKLRIIECEVSDTWAKKHSPSPVILSRWIKFNRIISKI
jgi:hypothetical protein